MAYDENTKMKELLKDEKAVAVLEQFVPGASNHPQLPMIKNFSLKKVASFPQAGISPDVYDELVAALKEL